MTIQELCDREQALKETVKNLSCQKYQDDVALKNTRHHCVDLQKMLARAEEKQEHLDAALQNAKEASQSNLLTEKRERELMKSKCALLIAENEDIKKLLDQIDSLSEDTERILKIFEKLMNETYRQRVIISEQKIEIQHRDDSI